MTANIGMKTMTNVPTSTPVSNRIIKWIMNGYDLNAWFEKNKREFIKKHNPKYYETLYGNKNN